MSFGDPLKETKHYQLPFLESVFGSSTRVIYIYIDAIVTGVICVVFLFIVTRRTSVDGSTLHLLKIWNSFYSVFSPFLSCLSHAQKGQRK